MEREMILISQSLHLYHKVVMYSMIQSMATPMDQLCLSSMIMIEPTQPTLSLTWNCKPRVKNFNYVPKCCHTHTSDIIASSKARMVLLHDFNNNINHPWKSNKLIIIGLELQVPHLRE